MWLKSKVISGILILMMLLALVPPVNVRAVSDIPQKGDTVSFAGFDWTCVSTDPYVKIVMDNNYGEAIPFDDNGSNSFDNSSIKTYLNADVQGSFYHEAFTSDQKSVVEAVYWDMTDKPDGTNPGATAEKYKIGLLSYTEFYDVSTFLNVPDSSETYVPWWLITPFSFEGGGMAWAVINNSETAPLPANDGMSACPRPALNLKSGTAFSLINGKYMVLTGVKSAAASADTLTPHAGDPDSITLTVRDSLNNTDTTFSGQKKVTVSGVIAAPDGTHGSFNGTALGTSSEVSGQEIDVTFGNGVASVDLSLNKAGAQRIWFSIEGLGASQTSIQITPAAGVPAGMYLTKDIAAPTVNGGFFSQQPEIVLKDKYGNISTGDSSTQVTVSKLDVGAWTLTGTKTRTAASGIVTFADLGAETQTRIENARLRFDSVGLTGVTSGAVVLENEVAPPVLGDTVWFADTEWICVGTSPYIKLLRKDTYGAPKPFDANTVHSNIFEDSSIKDYLNSDTPGNFYHDAFTAAEKAIIQEVNWDERNEYGMGTPASTANPYKVGLLSFSEYGSTKSYLGSSIGQWWLITPYSLYPDMGYMVEDSVSYRYQESTKNEHNIRPALCLKQDTAFCLINGKLSVLEDYSSVTVSVNNSSPVAGEESLVTLTVKDEYDVTDMSFSGSRNITVSGVLPAPDGSYGSFNGIPLGAESAGNGQTIPVTFTNGVATANLTLNKAAAQSIVFEVTASKTLQTDTLTITPKPAGATALTAVSAASSPSAGAANTLTLTVEDTFRNIVTGLNANKDVTVSGVLQAADGSYGSFNGIPLGAGSAGNGQIIPVTFTNGVATAELVLNKAAAQSIIFGVTASKTLQTDPLNITPKPAGANALTVTAAASAPTTGAVNTLTLQIFDTFRNTITDFNADVDVTVSGVLQATDGSYGSLNGISLGAESAVNGQIIPVTFTNGVATVNLVLNKAAAQSIVFGVTVPKALQTEPLQITPKQSDVQGLVVTAAASSPVAGAVNTLTLEMVDSFRNTITDFNANKDITVSGILQALDGSYGSFNGIPLGAESAESGQIIPVTFNNGVATANLVLNKAAAQSIVFGVTAATTLQTDPLIITPKPAGANALTAASAASSPSAGASNTITLTVQDAFRNIVTGLNANENVTVSGVLQAPDGSYGSFNGIPLGAESAGNGQIIPVTFTNGVVTADLALNKAAAQSIVFGVTSPKILNTDPLPITPKPASADDLTVTAAASLPTAGAANTLTLEIFDTFCNAVTDFNTDADVTVSGVLPAPDASYGSFNGVSLGAESAGNGQIIPVTFTNGVATANLILNKAAAQAIVFKVTASKTLQTDPLHITPKPAGASGLTVVTAASLPVAGAANTLTLTVVDSFRNTITDFNSDKGVTVSGIVRAPDGSCGSFNGVALDESSSSTGQVINVSFTGGMAAPEIVLNKASAQTIVLSINIPNLISGSVDITPVPSAAVAMVLGQEIKAPSFNGGLFDPQPVITLKDIYGNICVNNNTTSVTVSKKDAGKWILSGTTVKTAVNGIISFTDLIATNPSQVADAVIAFNSTGLPELTYTITLPVSSTPATGDIVYFGGADWICVGTDPYVKLLRKDNYTPRYQEMDYGAVNFEASTIKGYLNNTYYNRAFTSAQKDMIQETKWDITNNYFGKVGPKTLTISTYKIGLLSVFEFNDYSQYINPTMDWWLITPFDGAYYHDVWLVNLHNEAYNSSPVSGRYSVARAVRPVLNLKADTVFYLRDGKQIAIGGVPGAQNGEASADTLAPMAGAADKVTFKVRDALGDTDSSFNGNKNITISGVVQAPDGSYGSFNGTSLTAPSSTISVAFTNGMAAPDLVLNKVASQTISFNIETLAAPAANKLTFAVTPAAASAMVLTTDIKDPVSNGGLFDQQPVITLKDAFGNICTNDNSTRVTISKKDAGEWTLYGTLANTAANGVVAFRGLGTNNTGYITGARLAFDSPGLNQISSAPVSLRAINSPAIGDSVRFAGTDWICVGTVPYIKLLRKDNYTPRYQEMDYGAVNFEASTIKGYLNNTYYNRAFTSAQKDMIQETKWDITNNYYGAVGPKTLTTGTYKIGLLSVFEFGAYSKYINPTLDWWLITPCEGPYYHDVWLVDWHNEAYNSSPVSGRYSVRRAVRPALNLKPEVSFGIVDGKATVREDDKTGTISGIVADSFNNPLPGAEVSVKVGTATYSAKTSTDGLYTIGIVPEGSGYDVSASRAGYLDGTVTQAEVSAGADTGNVNFSLSAVSTGGNDTAGTGGNNSVTSAPQVDSDGNVSIVTASNVDKNTATVSSTVSSGLLQNAFDIAKADQNGVKKVKLEIPPAAGTKAYISSLPASFLSSSDKTKEIEIKSDIATLTVSGNMLKPADTTGAQNVSLTIASADKNTLDPAIKSQIGDRPVIELSLKVDGKQSAWSNDNAPVTVSINYKPTQEELRNPGQIVVWYIDGSGKPVCIPNGRYNPSTGQVTFSTTHFSLYAAGWNKVNFNDIPANAWYESAVGFIAARGITAGTGNGNYSPEVNQTRGEFIVMLLKACGIPTDENLADNFSDAGNTWYTGYLAAAKRLGVSNGTGGNMFSPEKEITRQEMFTLLYNALKRIGKLPQGTSEKQASGFNDAGDTASWAKDAIMYLAQTGIIKGNDGKLSPKGTTTRAEMAQVLYNWLMKQ